jgi:hypothetical protein
MLNYVIIGSDENPLYYDFWDVISKVWLEVFKITPVLGLISDDDSEIFPSKYGLVKKFKKIDGIDTGLLSQIVRFYLPKYLSGYCLVSDIDMMPLSKNYFSETCEELDENIVILHSSDNPECLRDNMYPMCYFAAHSKTFSKIFDIDLEWNEFSKLLHDRNESWFTDQKYLFEKINKYQSETENCIFLDRGWSGSAHKRIDRINWSYEPNKVKQGYYIDSHLLRPYSKHWSEIDKLSKLLYI